MSSSDTSTSSTSSQSVRRGIKRKRDRSPVPSKGNHTVTKAQEDSASGSDDDAGDAAFQENEVLSHAAQRKLKRKAQKEAQQPSSQTENAAADLSHKRQNSIWVGNLAFKTTEQALRAFFQRGIAGCEITRVNLPTNSARDVGGGRMRGENRGFAYIDFLTKDEKERAISLSEQHLDGRKLLIKDGDDFTGRPTEASMPNVTAASVGTALAGPTSTVGKSRTAQRILAAQKQPPAPTLFLGNLGFQATEQTIREMIEGHMKPRQKEDDKKNDEEPMKKKILKKVRLGTFEDSGLCKGFGFLDFVTTEDATAVLLDPRNHHLDGRKLVVEYASADAVRRGGGPGAKAHRDKHTLKSKRENSEKSGRNDQENPIDSEKTVLEVADDPPLKRRKREEGSQKGDGKARRTRPGAALALAQREKVAIVPSSGKKIVF